MSRGSAIRMIDGRKLMTLALTYGACGFLDWFFGHGWVLSFLFLLTIDAISWIESILWSTSTGVCLWKHFTVFSHVCFWRPGGWCLLRPFYRISRRGASPTPLSKGAPLFKKAPRIKSVHDPHGEIILFQSNQIKSYHHSLSVLTSNIQIHCIFLSVKYHLMPSY